MANVDNPNGFRFYKCLTSRPELIEGVVAASQTIAKGDALIISSGQIQIALSNSSLIEGVAAEAVTTGAGETDSILYYPAYQSYRFDAQCSGTYAASNVGDVVDIEGATGVMEVNENATTEKVFQILGMVDDGVNVVGENARVYGSFVRTSFNPVQDAE